MNFAISEVNFVIFGGDCNRRLGEDHNGALGGDHIMVDRLKCNLVTFAEA